MSGTQGWLSDEQFGMVIRAVREAAYISMEDYKVIVSVLLASLPSRSAESEMKDQPKEGQ